MTIHTYCTHLKGTFGGGDPAGTAFHTCALSSQEVCTLKQQTHSRTTGNNTLHHSDIIGLWGHEEHEGQRMACGKRKKMNESLCFQQDNLFDTFFQSVKKTTAAAPQTYNARMFPSNGFLFETCRPLQGYTLRSCNSSSHFTAMLGQLALSSLNLSEGEERERKKLYQTPSSVFAQATREANFDSLSWGESRPGSDCLPKKLKNFLFGPELAQNMERNW